MITSVLAKLELSAQWPLTSYQPSSIQIADGGGLAFTYDWVDRSRDSNIDSLAILAIRALGVSPSALRSENASNQYCHAELIDFTNDEC